MKRRALLKTLTLLPIATQVDARPLQRTAGRPAAVDLFEELGVRTFINAAGTLTYMTGSLMQDEVVQAIQDTSGRFCMLDELQDKVGEQIAKMAHAEAAMITCGASSAMTLGFAGVITGTDNEKVKQLPNIEGTDMKSEVICQRTHNSPYNHAFTIAGGKLVLVDTIEELEQAINENTAMLHFLHIHSDDGKIDHETWVSIGKKHGIPTSIDIAADVPPIENLWRFNDMGFDLVFLSGGKGIRAPQSTGYLMGRKHLIDAARLSVPPRAINLGRGHKVNKEEIVGAYVALKTLLAADHEAIWRSWEEKIAYIQSTVNDLEGIRTRISVNPLGNHTPSLRIDWDDRIIRLTGKDLQERLRYGTPSIEAGFSGLPMFLHQAHPPAPDSVGSPAVRITVWMMNPGEEKIVARRLREEFIRGSIRG